MIRARLARPRLLAWMAVAVVIVGLVVAYVLLRETSSPAQRIADAKPPATAIATAKVENRVLQSSLTLQGTVTGGTVIDATVPTLTGGTEAVVTSAAPKSGARVEAGSLLYAVSDEPVFVLQGTLPLYRSITPGMTGPDVAALQSGLENAGHPSSDRSGFYGWSTGQAVKALWKSAGFTPPRPDGIQDELDSARQAVDTAQPGADRARAIKNLRAVQAKDGPVVLLGSITMVGHLPATVVDSRAPVGATVSGEAPVSVAYGAPIVTLEATAAQAGQVHSGASAVIRLADGTSVKGTVVADRGATSGQTTGQTGATSTKPDSTAGSPDAGQPTAGSAPSSAAGGPSTDGGAAAGSGAGASAPSSGGQASVLVRPAKTLPAGAVGQPVSAHIIVATSTKSVQAVPVSAVRVRDDGTSEVVVVDGDEHRRAVITTAVTIGGWVQITGSDPPLHTGDSVVVGSGE